VRDGTGVKVGFGVLIGGQRESHILEEGKEHAWALRTDWPRTKDRSWRRRRAGKYGLDTEV